MRILLILLFFCQCLLVNAQPALNNSKAFHIKGLIKHYQPDANNGFLSIRSHTITGKSVDTMVTIDKDGSFAYDLFQPFSSDIEAGYMDNYFMLYSSPGDSLQITIDGEKWKQVTTLSDAIHLQGAFAPLIKQMQAFRKAYAENPFTTIVHWEDTTMSDEQAVRVRLNRMKEELRFADGYLKAQKSVPPAFAAWVRNYILYTAGFDITFTSFTTTRKKELTIKQLTNLLKDIPVNSATALHNSDYYLYISLLEASMGIIININASYKPLIKQHGLNSVPVYLDNIDGLYNGFAKQLMYLNCYYHNSPLAPAYEERFHAVIRDAYLVGQWQLEKAKIQQPFKPVNLTQALNDFKGDEASKSRLRSIFEAQKDKYVFITFWGTWCGPCMIDMPGFPAFINQFRENKPAFLFLGVGTEEEASKAVQEKYGIKGTFLTLTDNEAAVLNNLLKFYSYPTHFLLKPNSITTNLSIARVKADDAIIREAVEKMKRILEAEKE